MQFIQIAKSYVSGAEIGIPGAENRQLVTHRAKPVKMGVPKVFLLQPARLGLSCEKKFGNWSLCRRIASVHRSV